MLIVHMIQLVITLVQKHKRRLQQQTFRLVLFFNSYQSVLVDEAEAVQPGAAIGTLEVIVLML